MKTLTFRDFKEELPKDDQEIFIITTGNSMGFQTIEPRFVKVFYVWEEFDEDGWTGNSIMYDENEERPPNTKLMIGIDSNYYSTDAEILWCPVEDVDALVG